ncbi:MAG: hypothetical protein J3Q66DRAFT_405465 [Benniella sp.]|nr:MAG: hypothetical protein J3Q66DRAFT_405465 [Benniella sp.]
MLIPPRSQIAADSGLSVKLTVSTRTLNVAKELEWRDHILKLETDHGWIDPIASEVATSKPAWLGYMLHIGDLTFCSDAKRLRIPNLISAERFGNTTLARRGLRLEDLNLAYQNIVHTGDILQALQPSLRKLDMELKPSEGPGRIDMLITVPSAKRILGLEWKVVQLGYLDLGTSMMPDKSRTDLLKASLTDYQASAPQPSHEMLVPTNSALRSVFSQWALRSPARPWAACPVPRSFKPLRSPRWCSAYVDHCSRYHSSASTDYKLLCLINGKSTSTVFEVQVPAERTVAHLKNVIKAEKASDFHDVDVDRLALWKASLSTTPTRLIKLHDLTEEEKTRMKLEAVENPASEISKAFGKCPAPNKIHVIVQVKRKWFPANSPKWSIEPSCRDEASSLVFNEQAFKRFPVDDMCSFGMIRVDPRYAYFDRTSYISVVDSFPEKVLIFLRPPRFGKSLFLSTLKRFHGVENKNNYGALFRGLDVDRDVKSGNIIPSQYLIMSFDFSTMNRSPVLEVARRSLSGNIVSSINAFYSTYGPYLGHRSSDQLIRNNVVEDPIKSLTDCVGLVEETLNSVTDKDDPLFGVKGIYLLADEYDAFVNDFVDPNDQPRTYPSSLLKEFWDTVKSELGPRRIVKCFITGVSPLSIPDSTSGLNVATHVSWSRKLSGLCGLTEEDVLAALRLPNVCNSEDEVLRHFKVMKDNYYGYRFAPSSQVPHVFNTNTCLDYLQNLKENKAMDPRDVTHSEASKSALQILAASPVANTIISDRLGDRILLSDTLENHSIPYEGLVQSLHLTDLASEIATNKPTWLSYMLHIGGLTFCGDAKQLRIPNLVAAERFGNANLAHLGLRLEDVDLAFQNIVNTGDIQRALSLYRQMICKRDIHPNGFMKTEEERYRDSFYSAFFGNCHPSLRRFDVEAKITKPSMDPGRVNLLITVPSAKRILVLEWKVLQLNSLDLSMVPDEYKADYLKRLSEVDDILNVKFVQHDRFRRGRTIKEWILTGIQDNKNVPSTLQQLAEYMDSPEIAQLKKDYTTTTKDPSFIATDKDVGFYSRDLVNSCKEASSSCFLAIVLPRGIGTLIVALFFGLRPATQPAPLNPEYQRNDMALESGKVTPGQYLIVSFDFSAIERYPDLNIARNNPSRRILRNFKAFYRSYAPLLGDTSAELIRNNVVKEPLDSLANCVDLIEEVLISVNSVTKRDAPLSGIKGVYLLADEYDAFSNEYLDPNDHRPWEQLRTTSNSLLKSLWGGIKSNRGLRQIENASSRVYRLYQWLTIQVVPILRKTYRGMRSYPVFVVLSRQ